MGHGPDITDAKSNVARQLALNLRSEIFDHRRSIVIAVEVRDPEPVV